MPATLDNVTTADDYTTANELRWVEADTLELVVANAAAYVELAPADPERKNQMPWGGEVLVAPTAKLYHGVAGVRVRSAVAGVPAQVVAQLLGDGDPKPASWAPFDLQLSAQGAIGQPSVIVSQVVLANDVVVSALNETTANVILGSGSITADGKTKYRIEAVLPYMLAAAGISLPVLVLKRGPGPVVVGQEALSPFTAGSLKGSKTLIAYDTPPAGSIAYFVAAFVNASSFTVVSGGGAGGSGEPLPSVLTITTA